VGLVHPETPVFQKAAVVDRRGASEDTSPSTIMMLIVAMPTASGKEEAGTW
jgi:hypothetical protein